MTQSTNTQESSIYKANDENAGFEPEIALKEHQKISFWLAPGRVLRILSNHFNGYGDIEIVKVPVMRKFPEGFACLDLKSSHLFPISKFAACEVQSVWADRRAYLTDKIEEEEEEEEE